jgi:hypothetical protein
MAIEPRTPMVRNSTGKNSPSVPALIAVSVARIPDFMNIVVIFLSSIKVKKTYLGYKCHSVNYGFKGLSSETHSAFKNSSSWTGYVLVSSVSFVAVNSV